MSENITPRLWQWSIQRRLLRLWQPTSQLYLWWKELRHPIFIPWSIVCSQLPPRTSYSWSIPKFHDDQFLIYWISLPPLTKIKSAYFFWQPADPLTYLCRVGQPDLVTEWGQNNVTTCCKQSYAGETCTFNKGVKLYITPDRAIAK